MTGILNSFILRFQSGFAVVLITVCVAAIGFAQKPSQPNLSGTWVMEDVGRSFGPSEKDLIIERAAPNPSDIKLSISDDGSDIKVLRKFTWGDKTEEQELEYHTDGRGETNPKARSGKRTFHTRTRWKKDSLVIKFDSFAASTSGRPLVALRQVEWRLIDGGARLVETDTTHFRQSSTIDSSVSAPDLRQFSVVPPSITVRRVYKRVS